MKKNIFVFIALFVSSFAATSASTDIFKKYIHPKKISLIDYIASAKFSDINTLTNNIARSGKLSLSEREEAIQKYHYPSRKQTSIVIFKRIKNTSHSHY